MKEPIWILDDVVSAIHKRQLAEHGEALGVCDEDLLESALAAPRIRWGYEQNSIGELAACYACHITRNHPFVDGNKRTAHVCMRLFLKLNGADITADGQEKIRVMSDLSAGKMSFEELAAWVSSRIAR